MRANKVTSKSFVKADNRVKPYISLRKHTNISDHQEVTEEIWSWSLREVDYIHNYLGEWSADEQKIYVTKEDLSELVHDCERVLNHPELCEELLPSKYGYDEWYYKNLEEVIDRLQPELDSERCYFTYHVEYKAKQHTVNEKKNEIYELLIDNFDRMNMDTPSNLDEIFDFVYEDVEASADKVNWTDMDVIIAFRRWIESKAKQQ